MTGIVTGISITTEISIMSSFMGATFAAAAPLF
jgi:hypothetical protein